MSRIELIKEIIKLKKENRELSKNNKKEYGLVWEKDNINENAELRNNNTYPVLKEVESKSIISSPNSPDHILIEGENYHVLSIMQHTHKKGIDIIIIDPPYGIGNGDFKYNDKWIDKKAEWKHSCWLNFMEKRLALAKPLLKDTGAIFIHIDDHKIA